MTPTAAILFLQSSGLLLLTLLLNGPVSVCGALTAAEQQELLNVHNQLRTGEGASNMQLLTWNSDLAYMAQDWANRCVWAHGQSYNSSTLSQLKVGQNMYNGVLNMTTAVKLWYNEKVYYNYTTNSCAVNKTCGHYTQVVWSETNQIGCGSATCPTLGPILVCNYYPGGNVNGSIPFLKGSPCTQCSSGSYFCNNGLCDKSCKVANATCVCKAACKHCGTVTADCRCQCSAGWTGNDCTVVCQDTNVYCNPAPGTAGYLQSWCTDPTKPYVAAQCPAWCGKCSKTVCPANFAYLQDINSCIQVFSQGLTQINAQQSCVSKGAHLAYIDSEAKKNSVTTYWKAAFPGQTGQTAAWIGACRVSSSSTSFVWSPNCTQTGPPANTVTWPMTYTSWLPPYEPNNYGGIEWCVEMYNITSVGFIWNDLDCNSSQRGFYICEAGC